MSEIKDLLARLISCQSITPEDAQCQTFLIHFLEKLGFRCQRFDNPPVSNFFAHIGNTEPLFIFAGHTDVVSAGNLKAWRTDPFVLEEKEGMLCGRGTADMKGSLAAMLLASAKFVATHNVFKGSLGFLVTSGEEGEDYDKGTPYVMAQLKKRGITPQFCIVGEPSSSEKIADVIKIGRRGSLNGKIFLQGKQGHVAYPHLADNPIHNIIPVLHQLITKEWDKGNDYFPPTSLQITTIQSGGLGNNVIPGELSLLLNFRYSPEQHHESLKEAVESHFKKHDLNPRIEWRLSGEPFITAKGKLLDSCIHSIRDITKQAPVLSTSGGTSDARFIAPYGVEVVELGPVNATIHQANECVSLKHLEDLTEIYYEIVKNLLT